jgi:hypothetical protein
MARNFEDELIQSEFYEHGANICFDCDRSVGKCPWSEVDPETGKVKFEPVPGWKTKKKSRKIGRKWEVVEQIIECPLFLPTEQRGVDT